MLYGGAGGWKRVWKQHNADGLVCLLADGGRLKGGLDEATTPAREDHCD
jgi:hypothetical protein